jgi:hypothetical protein
MGVVGLSRLFGLDEGQLERVEGAGHAPGDGGNLPLGEGAGDESAAHPAPDADPVDVRKVLAPDAAEELVVAFREAPAAVAVRVVLGAEAVDLGVVDVDEDAEPAEGFVAARSLLDALAEFGLDAGGSRAEVEVLVAGDGVDDGVRADFVAVHCLVPLLSWLCPRLPFVAFRSMLLSQRGAGVWVVADGEFAAADAFDLDGFGGVSGAFLAAVVAEGRCGFVVVWVNARCDVE